MADVGQSQKMCEISLFQYVCELVLGVNVFDLDFGVQIDSIKQPIKSVARSVQISAQYFNIGFINTRLYQYDDK